MSEIGAQQSVAHCRNYRQIVQHAVCVKLVSTSIIFLLNNSQTTATTTVNVDDIRMKMYFVRHNHDRSIDCFTAHQQRNAFIVPRNVARRDMIKIRE